MVKGDAFSKKRDSVSMTTGTIVVVVIFIIIVIFLCMAYITEN